MRTVNHKKFNLYGLWGGVNSIASVMKLSSNESEIGMSQKKRRICSKMNESVNEIWSENENEIDASLWQLWWEQRWKMLQPLQEWKRNPLRICDHGCGFGFDWDCGSD